jgi:hypothetical protein
MQEPCVPAVPALGPEYGGVAGRGRSPARRSSPYSQGAPQASLVVKFIYRIRLRHLKQKSGLHIDYSAEDCPLPSPSPLYKIKTYDKGSLFCPSSVSNSFFRCDNLATVAGKLAYTQKEEALAKE